MKKALIFFALVNLYAIGTLSIFFGILLFMSQFCEIDGLRIFGKAPKDSVNVRNAGFVLCIFAASFSWAVILRSNHLKMSITAILVFTGLVGWTVGCSLYAQHFLMPTASLIVFSCIIAALGKTSQERRGKGGAKERGRSQ